MRYDPLKSSKVNDFHLISHGVCDFLLVINSNLGRISHCFRDTATYSFKTFHSKLELNRCRWTLTAYRKSPPPYRVVPSPTFCDLPFTHNTAWLAYHSALLRFKVRSKVNNFHLTWKPVCDFLLVINSNLSPILHRLATIHPWRTTNKQTDRRTTTHANSSTFTKYGQLKTGTMYFAIFMLFLFQGNF